MRTVLEEARTGAAEGGLPIGAALVDAHGRLVVTGSNCRVQDQGASLALVRSGGPLLPSWGGNGPVQPSGTASFSPERFTKRHPL